VFCTTGNDVVNVYITLTSRALNSTIRIISRANQESNVKKLYQAGANDVIQPFAIAAMVAAEYIGQPVAFEAIQGILRQENQSSMEAVAVLPGSALVDKSIAELDFAQRKLILIGVISSHAAHQRHKNRYQVNQQHFYFNPAAHFVLQEGDLLLLLGRNVSIGHFRGQFIGKKYHS
jgi:voltage-gated potassium channel